MIHKRQQQILDYALLLGLMALTALAIVRQPPLQPIRDSPIPAGLPDSLSPYQVLQPLFCESATCRYEARFDIHQPLPHTCPVCGSALHDASLAERLSLGVGTEVYHRSYVSPGNILLDVVAVVANEDRTSLHRPQNCLPAQGIQIDSTETFTTTLPSTHTLPMRLLTLHHTRNRNEQVSFAYWYTNGRVQTPYQLVMYTEIGRERIIHKEVRRWAYVAITAIRGDAESQRQAIATLAARLADTLPGSSSRPIGTRPQ